MVAFTKVIRTHRQTQAPLGRDGYRHAGNGTAKADRPLAAASPLGLPDESRDPSELAGGSTGTNEQRPRHDARAASSRLQQHQDEAWDALASSADHCTAPRHVKVELPCPLDANDEARFKNAFDEVALQLPPNHTQQHLDACAEEAWEQCFGIPVARTSREQVWASVPRWCLVDEAFGTALAPLFQALPDNYTDNDLLRALEQAWEESQGDNWQ